MDSDVFLPPCFIPWDEDYLMAVQLFADDQKESTFCHAGTDN